MIGPTSMSIAASEAHHAFMVFLLVPKPPPGEDGKGLHKLGQVEDAQGYGDQIPKDQDAAEGRPAHLLRAS